VVLLQCVRVASVEFVVHAKMFTGDWCRFKRIWEGALCTEVFSIVRVTMSHSVAGAHHTKVTLNTVLFQLKCTCISSSLSMLQKGNY
jgi:hypothetical protein